MGIYFKMINERVQRMLKGNTVTDMSKDDMKSKILSSLTDLFNAMDSGHKPEVVSDISIHISTILKIISDEYGNIKDNDVDFDIDPPENKIVNEG